MKLTPPGTAPRAEKRPQPRRHHNVADTDDYAWLRAANWQDVLRDPRALPRDIRAYLEAENAYLEATMAPSKALQDALFQEMKGRIKEDDSSVPAPDGPFEYYWRYRQGGEHPLLCRKPRGAAEGEGETLLLDGDAEAKGKAYFSLGGSDHSPDHKLLAYATDVTGSEYYTIRLRDVASGQELPDIIESTGGGLVWRPDSKGFYYIRLDDNHRPREVFHHRLGDDPKDDKLIYFEADPGFFAGISLSEEETYLLVSSNDHQTSETRLLPANHPEAQLRLVEPRRDEIEYDLSEYGQSFLIVTNEDGAEDYKLMMAPAAAPGRENWRDLVPHRKGVLLLGLEVTKRHVARLERENGLPRIIISRIAEEASGKIRLYDEHSVAFDEEAYSLGMSSGYEFDTDTLSIGYSSPTTPGETYDYDMAKRVRVLRKRQEIPSGHDPRDYVTRRIFAKAADGAEIPVTLLMRAGTKADGQAPLFLYGYGSYGMAMPAGFSTIRLSLVDRGFVFAIAHVRGGMEKGYHWYREGKREKKLNTFTDYVAVAEQLIAAGWTRQGRIIASGGSAGGLLVGAVLNMRPDLFLGAIADVPFVDTLNTILDDTLPLTPPEWNEWGNPIEDAGAFHRIRSYAPYENVRAADYPHILVTAGLSDPRVTYWEAAKWVAKLRERKTGDGLLLLKTNMEAGHQGASGRFDSLKEDALAFAFAVAIAGRPAP